MNDISVLIIKASEKQASDLYIREIPILIYEIRKET